MKYTGFVVFLFCICWCYSATFSILEKETGECSTNVNIQNGTATKDVGQWTVHLKMFEDFDIVATKQSKESPGKRKDLGYYKFYSAPATWFGAKQICEEEGAHLLVLNSEREFTTIKGVWDTHPKLFDDWRNGAIHVGLHDLLQEGHFVTLDGQSVENTGYSRWASGEPNNGVAANCALVIREGLFSDSHCNNLLAFFCEM